MNDNPNKLSALSIFLHWTVGITLIALMAVGWYMETNEVYSLYDIHKSIGIIIFVFIFVRVVWRLMKGFPKPVSQMDALQTILSKIVHWVLLLGTLAFPISGMIMSGAGGHGLEVFGLELLAPNIDPETGRSVAINGELAGMGREVHGILLWVFIVALVLHIGGALKHHFIDKDGTLKRMLGK